MNALLFAWAVIATVAAVFFYVGWGVASRAAQTALDGWGETIDALREAGERLLSYPERD